MRQYTGQISEMSLGIYYYRARFILPRCRGQLDYSGMGGVVTGMIHPAKLIPG